VQEAEMTGSSSDWRRCWSALNALAGSDPRNPAVLLELGVADDNLGQPGPAASVWTEAAALAPTSSAPEADLALLYQSEDRPGEARRAALDALEIDRGDQAAKRVLAEVDPDGT
jgi:Flp pilus assembly protein TadD